MGPLSTRITSQQEPSWTPFLPSINPLLAYPLLAYPLLAYISLLLAYISLLLAYKSTSRRQLMIYSQTKLPTTSSPGLLHSYTQRIPLLT